MKLNGLILTIALSFAVPAIAHAGSYQQELYESVVITPTGSFGDPTIHTVNATIDFGSGPMAADSGCNATGDVVEFSPFAITDCENSAVPSIGGCWIAELTVSRFSPACPDYEALIQHGPLYFMYYWPNGSTASTFLSTADLSIYGGPAGAGGVVNSVKNGVQVKGLDMSGLENLVE